MDRSAETDLSRVEEEESSKEQLDVQLEVSDSDSFPSASVASSPDGFLCLFFRSSSFVFLRESLVSLLPESFGSFPEGHRSVLAAETADGKDILLGLSKNDAVLSRILTLMSPFDFVMVDDGSDFRFEDDDADGCLLDFLACCFLLFAQSIIAISFLLFANDVVVVVAEEE